VVEQEIVNNNEGCAAQHYHRRMKEGEVFDWLRRLQLAQEGPSFPPGNLAAGPDAADCG
jgi:hypothetical protein